MTKKIKRCLRCDLPLVLRTWYCKECMPEVTEEALQEAADNWVPKSIRLTRLAQQRATIDRTGFKVCNQPGCGIHPKTDFTLQHINKDGLRGKCRKCSAKYNAPFKIRKSSEQVSI